MIYVAVRYIRFARSDTNGPDLFQSDTYQLNAIQIGPIRLNNREYSDTPSQASIHDSV